MAGLTEKEKVEIYKYANHLVLAEFSKQKIIDDLKTTKGIDETTAKEILNEISEDLLEAKKIKGKVSIIVGSLMLLSGLGVTILTLYLSRNGGFYIITFGLILGGIAKLIIGFIQIFSKSQFNRFE